MGETLTHERESVVTRRMVGSVLQIFPVHLRERLVSCRIRDAFLEEIRIRVGQPVMFSYGTEEWYLDAIDNRLTMRKEESYRMTEEDMQEMVTFLSRYSLYAFEEDIKSGFITLEGGHRVGLAGQVRMERGKVADIRYISFLNIRIAKQRINCAKEMVPYMVSQDSIHNTLIVSPPGIGKTTYLRDCIRILSDGSSGKKGMKVCVIDERSEIAACHFGVPQNDVGMRTDVLDRCSKAEGMVLMIRSMSPQILAVDELGSREDYQAVEQALNCGCRILGTVHAKDIQEIRKKEVMRNWMENQTFGRYIVLKKLENGSRGFEVYDEKLERLC